MTDTESTQRLVRTHRRRLAKLREQAALFGASTPPHILLEIEDITAQIAELEGEMPADPPAPKSGSGTTITVIGDGNVIATDGGIAIGGDVKGDVEVGKEIGVEND